MHVKLQILWNLNLMNLYIMKSSVQRKISCYPTDSEICEKGSQCDKTLLYRTNLASPLALCYIELPLWLTVISPPTKLPPRSLLTILYNSAIFDTVY